MTREEAINLEAEVRYSLTASKHKEAVDVAFSALREQEEHEGLKNSYDQLQAINDQLYLSNQKMGADLQKLLSEQEERSKGCEYCDKYDDPCGVPMIATEEDECDRGIYLYNGWICADGGSFCQAKVRFCPMCGRKLEVEE